MSDFINTIDSLGDDVAGAAFVDGTLTDFKDNVITKVGEYAFHRHPSIKSIDLPKVLILGPHSFGYCSKLTTVNFPLVKTIGDYSFSNCTSLTIADFPVATSVGGTTFNNCSKLTTANFPVATSTGYYAFQSCSKLTTVNFPLAKSVDRSSFSYCSSLETVNFPAATSIGGSAFQSCSNLTTADFPLATSIGSQAFYDCSKLATLILRSSKIVTLSDKNAITNTAIASGTGRIYVPANLIESYKTANNWSYYAELFRPLEAIGKFRIRFYDGNTLLQESYYAPGEMPVYTGEEPVHENPEEWAFSGWTSALVAVTSDVDYVVKWKSLVSQTRKLLEGTITSIESDLVTTVGYNFNGVKTLTEVSFPSAVSVGNEVFSYCHSPLTSVHIPSAKTIGYMAFNSCEKLTIMDLPKAIELSQNAFIWCSNLQTLILRSTTLCTGGFNAIAGTSIANGTGYIYVPASLIDSYKSAANWSTYASRFRAIEDYPDICGGGNE